jgi:hypothetical protein
LDANLFPDFQAFFLEIAFFDYWEGGGGYGGGQPLSKIKSKERYIITVYSNEKVNRENGE